MYEYLMMLDIDSFKRGITLQEEKEKSEAKPSYFYRSQLIFDRLLIKVVKLIK